MVPAGYSCFRARCGITPFEGCGYESVVVCLGWAIGAIRGLRLYRRGYPVGFGELSELFVGLGYSLVSVVSTKLPDGSFLYGVCAGNIYDRCGIRGPAVACRLLRRPDCVVKPVKAAPVVARNP